MTDTPRTILITGAGSGVGRGLAIELAGLGHRVLATDVELESARETAAQVESNGGQATAHQLDVTSAAEVDGFIGRLQGEPVEVLINNAGLQHVARLEEFDQARWDHLVDVMLRGACQATRAVLPGMREQGFGRIINIGSIHGLVASPFKSAYVAAKHGLVGFAKTIALETADTDITVNTICPTYIRTPLVDAQIAQQAQSHGISEEEVVAKIMLAPMPKRCFVTIEEVAATAEFLIGAAARNITGQAIVIDGGWTIQ